MGELYPRAWCATCGVELRLADVVLERCPGCGAFVRRVLVSRKTARAIGDLMGPRR